MKKVSSDKFGVTVQADDEKFDEKKVRELLKSTGGEIEAIYYSKEFLTFKPQLFEPKFILLLIGIALATSAGGYLFINKILYLPPFDWMMEQPRFNVQSTTNYFEDGHSMRLPVQGSVARGFIPYPYLLGANSDSIGKFLINPLFNSKATLELGKKKYLTFCSPCHGNFGNGDSRLNGQFPNPPTLHSDKIRNWSDGAIFHTITVGQNVMPAYQNQISRDERWAVVKYIRTLQRAYNAKESDLR